MILVYILALIGAFTVVSILVLLLMLLGQTISERRNKNG